MPGIENVEVVLTPLEAVTEKFTKANVHAALEEIKNAEPGVDTSKMFDDLIAAVKPQKGGGASTNPMQVIDGVNYHFCRLKDDYVIESEMNMSGGKSKSTSKLASKVEYRIGKAADDLNAKALKAFTTGDYENGAKLNAESDELRKTIEDKNTFTDEAMANSVYHPDFGKEVKEETNQNEDAADTADVI